MERILLGHVDLNNFRVGEVLIDHTELVRSLTFVFVLVVCGARYPSRNKDPLLHVRRPKDGFVNEISWRTGPKSFTNDIVVCNPVLASQLAALVKNANPQVVGIRNGSIRVGVLLTHAAHVELAVLDSGPLPLHTLVGVTFTFGNHKARHHVGLCSCIFGKNFKHSTRPIVKRQKSILKHRQLAQLHTATSLIVLRCKSSSFFKINCVFVVLWVERNGSRQQNRPEGWLFRISDMAQLIQICNRGKVEDML
mmetsp:Transcript_27679/g.40690  ORF Transcript_27679/g.40690 Transcript_27679/m.40690 type:complete len:251 (-) Transcript_27679:572-1324(-)